jgi:K+-transporting ATPase ATPase C chain
MWAHIRSSLILLVVLTAVTGVIYPLVITGIAQVTYPSQA